MIFNIVIFKDESGCFVVECPALPGCVSQGKTEREALDNIKDAIHGWLWAENQKAIKKISKSSKKQHISVSV